MHDPIMETTTERLHQRHDELFISFTEIAHSPERREQIRRELAEIAFELTSRCHDESFSEAHP